MLVILLEIPDKINVQRIFCFLFMQPGIAGALATLYKQDCVEMRCRSLFRRADWYLFIINAGQHLICA